MPLAFPALADDAIVLRHPAARDVAAITAACQDPEIPRFTRIRSPYTEADAIEFVRTSARSWERGSSASFAIADATSDRVLGSVGLVRLAEGREVAEIGYWVAREVRGRGVATRAVSLVSRWALRDLGVQRLELMTRPENHASQVVAARAGFTREGVLRSYLTLGCGLTDVVMFSLLPSDLDPAP